MQINLPSSPFLIDSSRAQKRRPTQFPDRPKTANCLNFARRGLHVADKPKQAQPPANSCTYSVESLSYRHLSGNHQRVIAGTSCIALRRSALITTIGIVNRTIRKQYERTGNVSSSSSARVCGLSRRPPDQKGFSSQVRYICYSSVSLNWLVYLPVRHSVHRASNLPQHYLRHIQKKWREYRVSISVGTQELQTSGRRDVNPQWEESFIL